MAKAREAFRTISEVADWLNTQPHVLRFWESKFSQVKPVKRAGGRRYYRPSDMALLGGIKKLLHDDGLTIKGVQKILRERGPKYVSSLSPQGEGVEQVIIEADATVVSMDPQAAESKPVTEPEDAPAVIDDVPPSSLSEKPALPLSSLLLIRELRGKIEAFDDTLPEDLLPVFGRLKSLHARLGSGSRPW